jgi:hypothetical protein
MKSYLIFALATSLFLSAGVAVAQKSPKSVYGAPVSATTHMDNNVKGELIAVQADSIWILSDQKLIAMPLNKLKRIDIYRHKLTGRRFFWGSIIGGLASSTALTAACSTVSDGCIGVFIGIGVVWTAVTAIAVPEINRASRLRMMPPYWHQDLNAYSRFPQGLPAGMRNEWVAEL